MPILTYLFQEKNLLPVFRELHTFLGPKTPFSQEMAKNTEKHI
jgi:hypothetical protein